MKSASLCSIWSHFTRKNESFVFILFAYEYIVAQHCPSINATSQIIKKVFKSGLLSRALRGKENQLLKKGGYTIFLERSEGKNIPEGLKSEVILVTFLFPEGSEGMSKERWCEYKKNILERIKSKFLYIWFSLFFAKITSVERFVYFSISMESKNRFIINIVRPLRLCRASYEQVHSSILWTLFQNSHVTDKCHKCFEVSVNILCLIRHCL